MEYKTIKELCDLVVDCPHSTPTWTEHGKIVNATTLIISKKPGNTGISRDIRTEFTTDLLLSD